MTTTTCQTYFFMHLTHRERLFKSMTFNGTWLSKLSHGICSWRADKRSRCSCIPLISPGKLSFPAPPHSPCPAKILKSSFYKWISSAFRVFPNAPTISGLPLTATRAAAPEALNWVPCACCPRSSLLNSVIHDCLNSPDRVQQRLWDFACEAWQPWHSSLKAALKQPEGQMESPGLKIKLCCREGKGHVQFGKSRAVILSH